MLFRSSPRAGSEKAHGEALGEDNVRLTKRAYGWPEDRHFLVPQGVAEHFGGAVAARGKAAREAWEARLAAHPKRAEFERIMAGKLPANLDAVIADYKKALAANPPVLTVAGDKALSAPPEPTENCDSVPSPALLT